MFDWRRHKGWVLSGCALALPMLFLAAHHLYGRWALARWKSQLAARAEKLTIEECKPGRARTQEENSLPGLVALGRSPSSTVLARIAPPAFRYLAPGVVIALPGIEDWTLAAGRSSRGGTNFDWQLLRAQLAAWSNSLQQARVLLHRRVLDSRLDFHMGFSLMLPHLGPLKTLAQHLKASALLDLHDGQLVAAANQIEDMLRITRTLQEEPILISQLVRHSILDFALHATWQALQYPGWSDSELASLQNAWQELEFLDPMEKALEMERAVAIQTYARMRSSVNFAGQAVGVFGIGSAPGGPSAINSVGDLFDYVDHHAGEMVGRGLVIPVWQFAWSRQDELDYLQSVQILIDASRACAREASAAPARQAAREIAARQQQRGSFDLWRHFMSRQIAGALERSIDKAVTAAAERELVVAAIALERHRLGHGHPPAALADLVPEFVPTVPRDYWGARPLSYLAQGQTGPVLYAVGRDGKDDGGDPAPADPMNAKVLLLEGRDVVWPSRAESAKAKAALERPAQELNREKTNRE
jgi:hypothetical protein